jgi:Ca2+-binding EF-hand superfamily protein
MFGEKEIIELKKTFQLFDKDGDGSIDKEEIYNLLNSLDSEQFTTKEVIFNSNENRFIKNLKKKEVDGIMRIMDKNKDGSKLKK